MVFDLPKITKAIKENHCFLMENSKRGKGVTTGGIQRYKKCHNILYVAGYEITLNITSGNMESFLQGILLT